MLNHLPRTRAPIGRTNRFSGSAFDYNLCHALISESRCLRIKKVTIIEFPVYVYLHVYHFDYRKRFAWIKPYDDVIYHVLNMMWNHAVWVLVNYKPFMHFTTSQCYQYSDSVRGLKKFLSISHGYFETGCIKEWVFILCVASIRIL